MIQKKIDELHELLQKKEDFEKCYDGWTKVYLSLTHSFCKPYPNSNLDVYENPDEIMGRFINDNIIRPTRRVLNHGYDNFIHEMGLKMTEILKPHLKEMQEEMKNIEKQIKDL